MTESEFTKAYGDFALEKMNDKMCEHKLKELWEGLDLMQNLAGNIPIENFMELVNESWEKFGRKMFYERMAIRN